MFHSDRSSMILPVFMILNVSFTELCHRKICIFFYPYYRLKTPVISQHLDEDSIKLEFLSFLPPFFTIIFFYFILFIYFGRYVQRESCVGEPPSISPKGSSLLAPACFSPIRSKILKSLTFN